MIQLLLDCLIIVLQWPLFTNKGLDQSKPAGNNLGLQLKTSFIWFHNIYKLLILFNTASQNTGFMRVM